MSKKTRYLWKVTFSDVRQDLNDVVTASNLSNAVDKVYKMHGEVCDDHLLEVRFYGVTKDN